MANPVFALIVPIGDGGIPGLGPSHPWVPGQPGVSPPIYHPGHPDHGLPAYPDQGLPGRPPRPGHPIAPGGRPVDPGWGWGGGEYPGGGPVRPGRPVDPSWGIEEGRPDHGLPPGPAHPWVPPAGEDLPPPPDDIADQVVLAIWNPSAQAWTVKTAPPAQPSPHA